MYKYKVSFELERKEPITEEQIRQLEHDIRTEISYNSEKLDNVKVERADKNESP